MSERKYLTTERTTPTITALITAWCHLKLPRPIGTTSVGNNRHKAMTDPCDHQGSCGRAILQKHMKAVTAWTALIKKRKNVEESDNGRNDKVYR